VLKRKYRFLRSYLGNTRIVKREHHGRFGWRQAAAFYVPWRRLMTAEGHCLEHEIPWLTFPAISRIEEFLEPSIRVFEYGSGGSTLFFCAAGPGGCKHGA
jgi:hypothetical protein